MWVNLWYFKLLMIIGQIIKVSISKGKPSGSNDIAIRKIGLEILGNGMITRIKY